MIADNKYPTQEELDALAKHILADKLEFPEIVRLAIDWHIAQLAKQEPECWYDGNKFYADEMSAVCDCADAANLRPLYAATMPALAPGVIDYCFIKEVSDKYGLDYNKFCAAYRAMLAAAPTPPNAEQCLAALALVEGK